jgi:hypothetical protein
LVDVDIVGQSCTSLAIGTLPSTSGVSTRLGLGFAKVEDSSFIPAIDAD